MRPVRAPKVKALVFDVFGTVVDWRGSLIREGRLLGRRKKLQVDWEAFADAWRAGYGPAMQRVRSGELPWTNIDALHRLILDSDDLSDLMAPLQLSWKARAQAETVLAKSPAKRGLPGSGAR